MTDASELAARLEESTYWSLFAEGAGAPAREAWSDSGDGEQLLSVVRSESAGPRARFLAAELLAEHGRPTELDPSELARVYVNGLRAGACDIANLWNFPDGPLGDIGLRVAALGRAALPPLLDALEDERGLQFLGSREASVGNAYRWRVKDVAAALLAEISGEPFHPDRDPAARDGAIGELRRSLGAGQGGQS